MEREYKTMRNIGAANIAEGVVLISVGMMDGSVSIVTVAVLMQRNSAITI